MEKLLSEDVPQIPMYYTPVVTPPVAALTGPILRTNPEIDTLVKIHQWQWCS